MDHHLWLECFKTIGYLREHVHGKRDPDLLAQLEAIGRSRAYVESNEAAASEANQRAHGKARAKKSLKTESSAQRVGIYA